MADSLSELLHDAVARGIVSADRAAALRQLAAEREAGSVAVRGEIPRGFNSVTIAYALGALCVVFAFGWFLVDRWDRLCDARRFARANRDLGHRGDHRMVAALWL